MLYRSCSSDYIDQKLYLRKEMRIGALKVAAEHAKVEIVLYTRLLSRLVGKLEL